MKNVKHVMKQVLTVVTNIIKFNLNSENSIRIMIYYILRVHILIQNIYIDTCKDTTNMIGIPLCKCKSAHYYDSGT